MTRPERMMLLGLQSSGVELYVVTNSQNEGTIELEKKGIRCYYMSLQKKVCYKSIKKLRRLIRENNFDILHFTFGKAATNALIASSGLKIKKIAYYGSMSLHWYDPSAYLGFLNHRIDHYICVSQAVASHVRKQLLPARRNKITVIPRGFDVPWLKSLSIISREELKIPSDSFIICCVAIVRRVKGLIYLLRAIRKLPPGLPLYFLLVGEGTDSCKIRKAISCTHYKNNFRIIGKVPFAPSYIAACDLYVQPSIHEGFGRALAEAMSLGKIVVATDGGGTRELITSNTDGIILPARNPEAIADIILKCYQNTDEFVSLRENANRNVENNFPVEKVITDTLKVYYKVTNSVS
jgi:L-malate glycosyltransferase